MRFALDGLGVRLLPREVDALDESSLHALGAFVTADDVAQLFLFVLVQMLGTDARSRAQKFTWYRWLVASKGASWILSWLIGERGFWVSRTCS